MEPYLPQQILDTYSEISSRFKNTKVKQEVLGRLIHDGSLTLEDIKKAIEISEEIKKEEKIKAEKRRAEQEAQRKQEMKPDSMIPKLWRSVKVQPERLRNYIATYEPVEELVLYLGELKTRSLHYASIYHGTLSQALQFLEFELTKRNIKLEKTKDKTKPKNYIT